MHGDETLKLQQNYHHTNLQKSSSQQQQQHKLPRWFIISPIVILCIVFLGLVYSNLSMAGKWREEVADEYGYPLRLRPGWFLDRKMDQSDFQWSSFRKFLPILAGSALIYSVISRWLFRNTEQAGKNIGPNGAIFQYHVVSPLHSSFYLLTSFAFLFFLFGINALYPITVALINYLIGTKLRHYRFQPLITWLFNLVILVSSDYYSAYNGFTMNVLSFFGLRNWYSSLAGQLNWSTYFNITMCRLMSYNMDLREMVNRETISYYGSGGADQLLMGVDSVSPLSPTSLEQQQVASSPSLFDDMSSVSSTLPLVSPSSSPSSTTSSPLRSVSSAALPQNQWSEYRRRQEELRSLQNDYNLLYYLMYVFYLPTYIAGPICSYNAFISYLYRPQKEVPKRQLIRMTVMLVVYLFFLELALHFMYFVGFNEHDCWRLNTDNFCSSIMSMSSMQVSTVGFSTLVYMYVKFTIIWRFFRVWALFDGQNVPENMTRCICNNYLVSEFWRNWHRSMYLWIVKYMYVPMGGKKTRLISVWFIFGFVAIWHDLWWRWVAWAYFNAFLMVLEGVVIHLIIPAVTRRVSLTLIQRRLIGALLGSLNMCLVACANLAIMHGFEGTRLFLGTVVLWGDNAFFGSLLDIFIVFVSCLVMFWIRDLESQKANKKQIE